MFQYTRELIINSADQFSKETANGIDRLHIPYFCDYPADKITKIVKVAGVAGTKASVAIPSSTTTSDAVTRYLVNVSLNQGDVDAVLANYTTRFKRAVVVEVGSAATSAKIKAAFVEAFKGLQEWPIYFDADDSKVKAKTPYADIRIDTEVLKYRTNSVSEMTVDSFTEGTAAKGVAPFGTYEFLLASHRLPTMENNRWGNELGTDRPYPGVLYNLYELTMESERNIGGYDVVGQKAYSITTHRIWVPTTIDATASTGFKAVMDSVFGDKTPVVTASQEVVKSTSAYLTFDYKGATITGEGEWAITIPSAGGATGTTINKDGKLIAGATAGKVSATVTYKGFTSAPVDVTVKAS